MPDSAEPPEEGPARRRDTWSLKTLVEEVTGRPITDLQDPSRPIHPNLKVKLAGTARSPFHPYAAIVTANHPNLRPAPEEPPDPVNRVYPPLVGATARGLHGNELEHHHETLESVKGAPEAPVPGLRKHSPGPSRRPERIYLHYLLLHLDRLSDAALKYLQHAVNEEVAHRDHPAELPPPLPLAATPVEAPPLPPAP